MNNTKGFTLVEILVAMAISMVMLFAIGMAIDSASRSSTGMERKVMAQQDVRSVLELMAMEIRMASYNPTFTDTMWRGDAAAGGGITSCTAQSTNLNYRGIQEATANSITVEMDISDGTGGDGQGALTDANEIISYNYVATGTLAAGNRYITRATNCGSAQSFLGDSLASGNPRTVRVINSDLAIPIFRYFNGLGVEIPVDGTANGIPAQTSNVRMIEITLAVETSDIDPETKLTRRMIYTTREVLRNH